VIGEEEYYCPQCGQRLFSHACKIKCPRCGYTEDCADALLVDYERQNARPKRRPGAGAAPNGERNIRR
jgi:uncharacterized Zn finger protein (UPF0148 family)